jgi:hypothetical protein
MTRTFLGRSAVTAITLSLLLVAAVVASGLVSAADEDHPVVGRWSITSDAGGAVWAFQPSGALFVSGPGEIMAEGTWAPAANEGELDAAVDMQITGQQLNVMAQVSPDATAIALYVTASEATRPDDWHPWPAESRLVGERFGMMAQDTPEPTEPPVECLRPQWADGAVDWDRCDVEQAAS